MSNDGTLIAKQHGIARSPKWSKVEKEFILANPKCPACTEEQDAQRREVARLNAANIFGPEFKPTERMLTHGLQVHHQVPFHYCVLLGRGDLELDTRNLMVLCEGEGTQDHHLLLGHLGNFKCYAEGPVDLCKVFQGKSRLEIEGMESFVELCNHRPKEFGRMSNMEKRHFGDMLDMRFPR